MCNSCSQITCGNRMCRCLACDPREAAGPTFTPIVLSSSILRQKEQNNMRRFYHEISNCSRLWGEKSSGQLKQQALPLCWQGRETPDGRFLLNTEECLKPKATRLPGQLLFYFVGDYQWVINGCRQNRVPFSPKASTWLWNCGEGQV